MAADAGGRSTKTGGSWIFLLLLAAALGTALFVLPDRILSTYQGLQRSKPELAEPYLWSALIGCGIALIASVTMLVRLWLSSRARDRLIWRRPTAELSANERLQMFEQTIEQVKVVAARGAAVDRQAISLQVAELEAKHEAQRLEIAAFGTVSSGKSALLNTLAGRDVFSSHVGAGTTVRRGEVPWPGQDRVTLVDAPGIAEVGGAAHAELAATVARSADVVLFVIDGALKNYEHEALTQLARLGKRMLVCVNKVDWISPEDRALLLDQLASQLSGTVERADIVMVQSRPVRRVRTRVFADGREQEDEVIVPASIDPLATRLLAVVQKDGKDLLLANLLLRAEVLAGDARDRVRAYMNARANEIVESHMWQAGAAAALVPLPMLDFAASSAVLVKMTLAIAKVYGQPMTLESAGLLVRELGKNLASVLGTSALLPAVSAFIGSALKSVPGVGTLAGGALQGVVQALVARWAGRVLIAHFEEGSTARPGSLAELSRAQWKAVTQTSALVEHVRAGVKRLGTKSDRGGEP